MGDVQATLKVMPVDAEVNFDDLEDDIEDELPDEGDLVETQTEPVAFGLEALMVAVTVPDGEGGTDDIEDAIDDLDDVESVTSENVTRL